MTLLESKATLADTMQAYTGQEHEGSQAWFWTPEWHEGERDADEDIAAGRIFRQHNTEEFLAFLHARPLPDAHPDAQVEEIAR